MPQELAPATKLDELKIACIYYSSLDDWSGGTAGLKNMLQIFKSLGISVEMVSYSYHSQKFGIEHKQIDSSLTSTTIHLPTSLPDFVKAFAISPAFIYSWNMCKRCHLIFADLSVLPAMPAVILGRIFDKPVILHYLGTEFKHIPDVVYKYIARNAALILPISHFLIGETERYGCKRIVFLPAFVDTKLFKLDLSARSETRQSLGINSDDTVIGYAGPFSDIEGVSFLLQAFTNLLGRFPNIKLLIIGGGSIGEQEAALIKGIEDKVVLVPPQPHEEVPRFLSACDITCCPKIDCAINRAANPVKVVEYLSMGLPTVCSSVGGISHTIEDGVDGFLVKPGDVKDLEEKLAWIILNSERAKEVGERGRETAIAKYSFEAIENTIRQAISGIVDMKKMKQKRG